MDTKMSQGEGLLNRDGRKNRPLVLHPFLLAAFPVLYIYASNIEYAVPLPDVLPWLAGFVAGAGVAMLVAWMALRRDSLRAGLVTTALVVLFFSYGQIFVRIEGFSVRGVELGRHLYLLPVWGGLAVLGVVAAVRARRHIPLVTKGLNIAAAVLVLSNLATIGWYELRSGGEVPPTLAQKERNLGIPVGPDTEDKPDIFYIILDRYGGEVALRGQFGFDNRPFLEALETRGFYVASDSTTNYPKTAHSLATSLNLEFLDGLDGGGTPDNWGPIYKLLQNHKAGDFLKSKGYRYVHIGSWWRPTAANPQADINVKFKGDLSEFSSALLESTVLPAFGGAIEELDHRHREYLRPLFQFEKLVEARDLSGPTFVFAHILLPHDPYLFDRQGRYVSRKTAASRTLKENYIEQLRFTNKKVLEVVDRLLEGPEESRPVVIIQADEGPPGVSEDWNARPGQLSPGHLKRRFSILNVFHLPAVERPGVYPSITPVNTFRLLFNLYFDAGLALLPDDNYMFPDLGHLYTFTRVTNTVQG
jgi:hypothetical protein